MSTTPEAQSKTELRTALQQAILMLEELQGPGCLIGGVLHHRIGLIVPMLNAQVDALSAQPVEPDFDPDVEKAAYERATRSVPEVPAAPSETVALITECRDALAEELSGWDIDPPLHHIEQAHDRCVAWLAAHPTMPAAVEARTDALQHEALPSAMDACGHSPGYPITAEHHIALREAHLIDCEKSYFTARPGRDTTEYRLMWGYGFERGFNVATEVYQTGQQGREQAADAAGSDVNKCAVSGMLVTDIDACSDCDPCLFGQPKAGSAAGSDEFESAVELETVAWLDVSSNTAGMTPTERVLRAVKSVVSEAKESRKRLAEFAKRADLHQIANSEDVQRDAQRYRWLRKFIVTGNREDSGHIAFFGCGEGLDEVLDSAARKGGEAGK